jgi:tetratricopeptide (TPR) repeat protein
MRQLVVFISYSRFDGKELAARLYDALPTLSPPIQPTIDFAITPGYRFEAGIQKAIGDCDVVLFVVTRDSVQSDWCKRELGHAIEIGKRVLCLRVHEDAAPLLALEGLSSIDFTGGWRKGWRGLQQALARIDAPEARVEELEEQRRLLARKLQQASGPSQKRVERDLRGIEERIREEQRRLHDLTSLRQAVDESVQRGQAQEKAGEAAPINRLGIRSVNDPTPPLPNQFLDRVLESHLLNERLADASIKLVAVTGRDGIGKTALASQLLYRLRKDPSRLPVDAFIYLTTQGTRPVTAAILLEDLRKVVPDHTAAARLAERLNDAALSLPEKLDEVVAELAGTRVLVVIDNAERLLDAALQLRDPELDELIKGLLLRHDHGVKLVLVTRDRPDPLLRRFPGSARLLELDKGLPTADAHEFLRNLDNNNILGLQSAPEEHLERARQLTNGHPRALEAVFSTLETDPEASLPKLLNEMEQLPANQDMVRHVIVRMFDRLDPIDRRVMQALAVYGRPVRAAAVDHLLRSYLEGYESEPTLRRLLERRLVRRDGDYFYLPSPDGELMLDSVPRGEAADRDRDPPPLTQLALLNRAAAYFLGTRKARVVQIDDLSAQFAEIDLRMRGEDYMSALALISHIDHEYLRSWGQSDAVAHWREQLRGHLDDPNAELHNLTMLALARRQQDDHRRAIEVLMEAEQRATELGYRPDLVRIRIALASARWENGEASRAAELYEQALRAASRRMPLQEAKARSGLLLCLGETGRFQPALDQLSAARGILEKLDDEESQVLEAELLLNAGWLHGLVGRTEKALESLREGRKLAHRLHEELLEGMCLNAEAAALIDEGLPHQAIEPAADAVAIGTRTHNPNLSREANGTLALAYLCIGNMEAASVVAEAAARFRRSRRALGAFALRGITAFRVGEEETARLAFLDAHVQAEILRERENSNFQVLDTHGLVLCGLALCGDVDQFDRAISAYQEARRITSEPSATRRSRRLLAELSRGRDPDELAAVRHAAAGR